MNRRMYLLGREHNLLFAEDRGNGSTPWGRDDPLQCTRFSCLVAPLPVLGGDQLPFVITNIDPDQVFTTPPFR